MINKKCAVRYPPDAGRYRGDILRERLYTEDTLTQQLTSVYAYNNGVLDRSAS